MLGWMGWMGVVDNRPGLRGLVNSYSLRTGKIHHRLQGKLTISTGPFSIAMLVYQRVNKQDANWKMAIVK